MPRNTIESFVLTCLRCDHRWPRRDLTRLPKGCPKCHSPYWNRPRATGNLGRPKNLQPCPTCGRKLGTRERREHKCEGR